MPKWSTLARITLTIAIFVYVFAQLEAKDFTLLLSKANMWYLLLAIGAYGVTTALSIWRWQILLRACHTTMQWIRTFQLTMIGLFANSFMLGSMGGDVLKAFYATREIPHLKPTVVTSIIMERLLGFAAMFIVSTALILSRYELLTSEIATRWAVYLYFAVMGLVAFIVIIGSSRRTAKLIPFHDVIYNKLAANETLKQSIEAYRFFLKHAQCFWGGMLISAAAHFALMITFYFVALSLNMTISFWDLAAILPLVGVVTLLPITVNGMGLREFAFIHFLSVRQVPEEVSVALSLGGFFVILFWNLLGGFVYLQFTSAKPPHIEIEEESTISPQKQS